MSFTENEPAQPQEGQDGGEQQPAGDSPYSEYLSRIEDEQARAVAEEGFKAFDANTTRKFQQHADERKQWEPYQQLGLQGRDPQQVAWALQVAEFAQQDPAAFVKWAQENYGQPETPALDTDEYGFQDPQQQLEALLDSRLTPLQQMVEQFGTRFQEQEQQQNLEQWNQFVEGQMTELQTKHGDRFDREALELFLDHFVNAAETQDDLKAAVPRAWEALEANRNKWQKAAFQEKVDAPSPAEGGGVPSMTPEKLTGLRGPGSAMEEARKILQQINRQ